MLKLPGRFALNAQCTERDGGNEQRRRRVVPTLRFKGHAIAPISASGQHDGAGEHDLQPGEDP